MNQYNVHNIKIDPRIFQHAADKKAVDSIRSMPEFQKVLQFISKNSIEKQMGVIYRSSMAQITPEISPRIHRMLEESAEMFEVSVIPDFFIMRSYPMVKTMIGIEKPLMLMSTQMLENLSERMLWGIVASNMAGIKNGFCEVKFVEWICKSVKGLIPDPIASPLNAVLNAWHKYAEYSFDRANLIATGDFNVVIQGILTGEAPKEVLEKVNFADPNCEYMKQCREFMSNEDKGTKILRNYQSVFGINSFYAIRYLELFQFYQTQYHDLVEDYLD